MKRSFFYLLNPMCFPKHVSFFPLFNKFGCTDPAGKPVLLMGSLLIQCSCHQSDLAFLPQCHYTLGAGLFSYTRPQLLDPTSSTSRTQTFVGLISSAGALSYFVSEAAGDVKRWKCRVAFYPSSLALSPPALQHIWSQCSPATSHRDLFKYV